MKGKIELDVDFIGSQPSALTKDEEKTDFVRKHNAKRKSRFKIFQGMKKKAI